VGIQKGRVEDGADSTSSRHLLLFLVGYSGIELTVTKGFDLLTPAKMGPGNPNYETMDDNPNFGGLGRIICSKCGVVMMTALFARPHTELNDGDEDAEMVCVFPGAFTEKMSAFVQAWQPTNHVHCANAILPMSVINNGLDKWTGWPESEPRIRQLN